MEAEIILLLGGVIFCAVMIGVVYFSNRQVHPKALFLLFFAEMWERFSFYGMRALLILYMVSQLKYADTKANLIYGTYTALVYLMPFFGGMAADRILGYRRAILLGGVLMAAGHFILALPASWSFFAGMAFLISGNGFFKPNISTMVGKLYSPTDGRRDGAFSIFYMGVNIGAAIGGLLCGYIGQKGYTVFNFMTEENSWHYGFGLAGIFMVFGLLVFGLGQKVLGEIGLPPQKSEKKLPNSHLAVIVAAFAIIPLFIYLFNNYDLMGYIMVPFIVLATMYCILIAENETQEISRNSLVQFAAVYFAFLFFFFYESLSGQSLNSTLFTLSGFAVKLYYLLSAGLVGFMVFKAATFVKQNKVVGGRQITAVVLVLFSVLFWAFYEQGGGSLNLYADRNVNLYGMPAAAVNNFINPFYIILLSFPFAWLWLTLSKSDKEPSSPMKFTLAFFQLGIGFSLFVLGGKLALQGQVSFVWYALGYLLLTTGELCISPIGLSMITKLATPKFTGMMMGFWFLASAMGQYLAGVIGTLMAIPSEGGNVTISAVESLSIYSGVFMKIFYVSIGGGILLLVLVPILKKWMHGIR